VWDDFLPRRAVAGRGGVMKRKYARSVPVWPIGTSVDVLRDDGTTTRTKTRSEPWQLRHGEWVIMVEGIAGGYLWSRVTVSAP
jgi:hypothetical protein